VGDEAQSPELKIISLFFPAKSRVKPLDAPYRINHFRQKNTWHSSYAQSRIIKAVSNKQTRPIAGPSHLTHNNKLLRINALPERQIE
jgi:hypothetical protein